MTLEIQVLALEKHKIRYTYRNDKENLYRFVYTQKIAYYHKNEWQHKHDIKCSFVNTYSSDKGL
jgi:hypothetical protein